MEGAYEEREDVGGDQRMTESPHVLGAHQTDAQPKGLGSWPHVLVKEARQ